MFSFGGFSGLGFTLSIRTECTVKLCSPARGPRDVCPALGAIRLVWPEGDFAICWTSSRSS